MDAEYFKEYYLHERNHWWFKARNRLICEKIERYICESGSLRILNVGAATGATSTLLCRYGEVTSLEKDPDCCSLLRLNKIVNVVEGDAAHLPFDDSSFDVICAFDVIEHIEDDTKAVNEMKRVCKKQGHLILTTSADKKLWGGHDVVNHHIRRYGRREYRALFENAHDGRMVCFKYYNSSLYLPLLFYRMLDRKKMMKNRKSAGSDLTMFRSNVLNRMLSFIFNADVSVNRYFGFPFGVGIISVWRKN